jgi:hypothetical protein
MNPVDPRQFTDDQIPHGLRPVIANALRTGYRTAERLWTEESWLQTPSATYNHGRLISWAIDYGLFKLVESGALPFDCSWEYFAQPTGRYLALRPSHSVITVSQIADPLKQPRNVVYRENRRVNNQPFFDLAEFASENEVSGEPHILLTHGHQSLNFAHLCVPDPVHSRGYRYRTENLIGLPYVVEPEGPHAEDTDSDFDNLGLLKDDIAQWRRDHADDE